jgi:hypothetical protein
MGCCCCKNRHLQSIDELLLHDPAVCQNSLAADEIDRILNSAISTCETESNSPSCHGRVALPGGFDGHIGIENNRWFCRTPAWAFSPISNRKVGPIVCGSSECTGTDIADACSLTDISSHIISNIESDYCDGSLTRRSSIDSSGFMTPFSDVSDLMNDVVSPKPY